METVDHIVARMEKENGRFSTLLMGVIESAPFQRTRNSNAPANVNVEKPLPQRAKLETKP